METETAPGTASPGTLTETVSAERAAADAGDVGAFMRATAGRRTGKAPADVTREKVAPVTTGSGKAAGADAAPVVVAGRDGAPAKGPTPEDRAADERLATRVKAAIDTATTDYARRIRELEAQIAGQRTPAEKPPATGSGSATPARKALTKADIARYQALPGAPKLDDKDAAGAFLYDTSGEHAVALAEFVREARDGERAEAANGERAQLARVQREAARVTTFAERIDAFKSTHADQLVERDGRKTVPLSPEIGALHGYAKLAEINHEREARGLAPVPATVDHAIAEELYDSEIPMEAGLYLSTHPEDLKALRACTSPAQLTRAFGALEERVRKTTTTTTAAATTGAAKDKTSAASRQEAEAAVTRSVSSAKPLKGTLGRPGSGEQDPELVAVAKDDYRGFADVQRARRLEVLQGRRR